MSFESATPRLMPQPVAAGDLDAARLRVQRARHIVIKVGSNVLVGGGGGATVINRRVFCDLVESIATLSDVPDRQIVLVTSGAVAVGRRQLGLFPGAEPDSLSRKQALAAVGQPELMRLYADEFAFWGKRVAQLLLTRDDFNDRGRFLNARTTVRELTSLPGLIPIANENDTVANEEIRMGDNDQLAALMTTLVGGDLLVILSDVPGLCDSDPGKNPGATLIPHVYADDPALAPLAGGTAEGGTGTGGMASKLRAARMASAFGVPTVIAAGREPDVLGRALSGAPTGTLLVSRNAGIGARKAWIRFGSRPLGVLSVDDGAEVAVRDRGKSLLPSGVTGVSGDFGGGAVVNIQNPRGTVFARGLASYASADIARLAGVRSSEIASVLGFHNGDAVVHRDDLVLMGEADFEE